MPAPDTAKSNHDWRWPGPLPALEETLNLAHEVAQLRKEIAELRRDLAPAKSLILVGQQVLDEFKRLRRG